MIAPEDSCEDGLCTLPPRRDPRDAPSAAPTIQTDHAALSDRLARDEGTGFEATR